MDRLIWFKKELLKLCPEIGDAFTNWYIAAQKAGDGFSLMTNPVREADLEFMSLHKKARIPKDFYAKSEKLFLRYLDMPKTSHFNKDVKVITQSQLERLKKIYTGDDFDRDYSEMIGLYKFVGLTNTHLSIPPIFKGIELFGSPLNTHNPFCSIFEIDKKFGSLGNFFSFEFKPGNYLCNPPFEEKIMERMATKLIIALDSVEEMNIFITIPVWDSKSQREHGLRDFGLNFEAYETLTESSFCTEKTVLPREYCYWNYFTQKKVPATATHAIIMSNAKSPVKLDFFLDQWKKWLEN